MRFAPILLAAALVVAPTSPTSPTARADDAADAKAIIEKAIKAHGHKPGPPRSQRGRKRSPSPSTGSASRWTSTQSGPSWSPTSCGCK
jgi:hypothetical protein